MVIYQVQRFAHLLKSGEREFLIQVIRRIMRKWLAVLFVGGLLFIYGCAPKASITIAGSTSVQPFAELLAEEYMNLHPQVRINVQGGGSSAGILAALSGTADIGMSSRELTGDEKKLLVMEIATDGLVLILHPSNPVSSLTLSQVREIYAGNIKNWYEVGGQKWNIHVVTREEGSGTRDAFQKLVMGNGMITPTAVVQDSNGAVREVVAGDPAATGFISLGLVNERVKALAIDGVAASRENILSGSYQLHRRFLFLTREPPSGEIKQFIDFVLSAEGQAILTAEGLITFAKVEPWLAQLRKEMSPLAFVNAEWVANHTDRGRAVLELFRKRIKAQLAAK